jgi:SNF2 family DNA or RNA helicase
MIRQHEALELGNKLLQEHNISEWKIEFNKSPTKLGQCWYQNKIIAISTVMLNSTNEQQFVDTMLHEIAHALVGPNHAHDDVWKAKAKEIGCTASVTGLMFRNESRAVSPAEQKERVHIPPLTKKCPTCGKTAIETSRANFGDKTYLKLECGHLIAQDKLVGVAGFNDWTSKSGKKLFKYQVEGAEFIRRANGRCLIADEPGLGKTAQACSFLNYWGDLAFPCGWITKKTLTMQALKENMDWLGIEKVGLPQIIRHSKFFPLPNTKLFIISMDLLRRIPQEKLDALGLNSIIFDEVQHIKNPDSTRTQEVRKLVNSVKFFIGLSGTPWKNRASEYFSVLNMLMPERFPSYKHFQNRWVNFNYDSASGKWKEGGIRNISQFREFTKDFVIRRMRDDVLPDLPKINRQVRYVELEDIYGEAYEKAEGKVAAVLKDLVLSGGTTNTAGMAAEMMKLKHITGLAKVDAQVEDAIEFLEDTEDWQKLTIFHHHIDVGDDLENKLNTWLLSQGLNPALRLKGGEDPDSRSKKEEAFKTDVKNRLLIASTLASGEGLNFQFCQNASMMERQWNAANEEQAELRFSRPLFFNDLPPYLQEALFEKDGTPKKVSIRVPYMICAGTIDELLTNIVESKRVNFRRGMNPGEEELQFSESDMIKELAEAILRKRYGNKAATA